MNDLLILGYLIGSTFFIGILIYIKDKFKKNDNSK